MGLYNKIKSKVKQPKTIDELKNDPNMIEVYDEYGRQMFVTKDEWKKNVLPGQIKKDWNNADRLYSVIVSALYDEFYKDVVDASARLMEIDTNHERSATIRGITLMKNGKIHDAEKVLRDYIKDHGPSGAILTNLSKIYAEQGDNVKSYDTLQNALELDPNQDNALEWFMALNNEQGGESQVKSALIEVAGIKGSWRPQLWLARYALEQKDLPSANKYYKDILGKTSDSDALMMISGDLGNNGYIAEIIKLIAPIYVPEKHGPQAGMNLLQAYKQTGKYKQGLELLHKMRLQEWRPYEHLFVEYSNAFEGMKPAPEQDLDLSKDKAEVLIFTRPIWMYGLGKAKWLEIHKEESAPIIMFLPLNAKSGNDNAQAQKEDTLGRLSRGIPLMLAEPLYFSTSSSPQVMIFAFPMKGVILMGGILDWKYLEALPIKDVALFVTGEISKVNEDYKIDLHLWDTVQKKTIDSYEVQNNLENLGKPLIKIGEQLIKKITSHLSLNTIKPPAYFTRPPENLVYNYIEGLAQSLTLTMVNNNFGSADQLWGERNIYGSAMNLAIEYPQWTVAKFLFASNMLKGKSFNSKASTEFKKELFALISKSKGVSPEFDKLAPKLFKYYGDQDQYKNFRKENEGKHSEYYDEWLQELEDKS